MGRVDRKEGGNGEGDFYDGMPVWTYFSRATPGHQASNLYGKIRYANVVKAHALLSALAMTVTTIITKFYTNPS